MRGTSEGPLKKQRMDGEDDNTIASARVVGECKDDVEIKLSGGSPPFTVPAVFLRESCRCSECLHPTTLQRIVDDVDPDIAPGRVAFEGPTLSITWADGHVTELEASWLASHVRPWPSSGSGVDGCGGGAVAWTAEWMRGHLDELTFNFDEVCARGPTTRNWVSALRRFGLTRLTGAAQRPGELQRLSAALHVPLRATVRARAGR